MPTRPEPGGRDDARPEAHGPGAGGADRGAAPGPCAAPPAAEPRGRRGRRRPPPRRVGAARARGRRPTARVAGTTERVTFGSEPTVSADGRLVAFASSADNLVPGDTNRGIDAFVRDRRTGVTRRASVSTGGAEAKNANSDFLTQSAAISPGGRFVAFDSFAPNLVPGDTNSGSDIFARDRQTGTTERVSLPTDGTQSNGFGCFSPSVSAGGRFVAFDCEASNLVPGDTNSETDVFVRTR